MAPNAPTLKNLRLLARFFDWRAAEARFNRFPQFTTEINGENVHFYHIRSPEPDALPLIITHGYPGSVAEFLDIFARCPILPATAAIRAMRFTSSPRPSPAMVFPALPATAVSA